MPAVNLSDAVFAEMKTIAEPLVDTPESVIARLIREEANRRTKGGASGASVVPSRVESYIRLNPLSHESLLHARLISASINGVEMLRPKWNAFMEEVHVLALKQLGGFENLRRATGARVLPGSFEKDGFKYLPGGDFSIQGVEANLAWDHALKLARLCGLKLKVVFEWRNKAAAAHPGERGMLEWPSASQQAEDSSAELEPRVFGAFKGRVKVSDDFDAPLPRDVQAEFEK